MPNWITQLCQYDPFPDPQHALQEPNGLLAVGGDLSSTRLLSAYQQGIFPWFDEGQPIMWWSPDPRAILFPHSVHVSRSMKKNLRRMNVEISVNQAFNEVIEACAQSRKNQLGSWITRGMISAYQRLHKEGHAHSIEVWQENQLVGGLYGLAMGATFCGESMFHTVSNTSKIAFIFLCQHWSCHGGRLIDCQMQNTHLASLGVIECSRATYLYMLKRWCHSPISSSCWQTIRGPFHA